jgi:hypothetical protein
MANGEQGTDGSGRRSRGWAMSPAALAIVLAVAFGGLAVVLNHCYARLAFVELALNEGLPPGHQPADSLMRNDTSTASEPRSALPDGIHVFLSRNCHACQRLIDELDQCDLTLDATLYLRYIDRPRPIASSAADRHGASLHHHEAEVAARLGADPLPYTIVIGAHDLVSQAVTPTVPQVLTAARDAGFFVEMG